MAETCKPADLVRESDCFECISVKQLIAVQTYLLAVKAGIAVNPESLVAASVCFSCLPVKKLLAIQTYLYCQIAP